MLAVADIFDIDEWITDSGANSHTTSTSADLQEITHYDGAEVIKTANGERMPITQLGSASKHVHEHSFTLSDILIVLQFVFIHKFTSEYNFSITLDFAGFSMKDLSSGKTLFQGPHKNDCKVCRSHKLPFQLSSSTTAQQPLEFLHMDLWGPCHEQSVSGSLYYANIVDDYTKFPDYNFLKVCGCSCFPWLKPYTSNKLEPRSKHCVFLGYSLQHKGYRCLEPSTVTVYISRHVTFNETSFPYKDARSPSVSNTDSSDPPSSDHAPTPSLNSSTQNSSVPVTKNAHHMTTRGKNDIGTPKSYFATKHPMQLAFLSNSITVPTCITVAHSKKFGELLLQMNS
ncbi:uncharacterized protein LOC113272533 [Papaver somniferum]|uniref:uncharacterized protein LOC113272533 n=1 Tax=Papaver somniferum TaxID=3469 RepID=UPI000E703CE5|nr:uncharacterized protein LOC113272533 [Papaver somniferum]